MVQQCYEHKQVAYNDFCPQNILILLKYCLRNLPFPFYAIDIMIASIHLGLQSDF